MSDVLLEKVKYHLEPSKMLFMVNGHDSIQPMLFVEKDGEQPIITVLEQAQTGSLYEAVQERLGQLPYVPDTVILISDSFYLTNPDEEYIESIKRGTNHSLGTMFALGDLRVKEAINITLMCPEAMITLNQPYKWTPSDGWEWDDIDILDSRESKNGSDWNFNDLINNRPRRPIEEILEDK